ncbi:MAG: transglutaminase domain-containing protein [Deltaproteobacteria bacterium]|nr:transglutaminase domain-containing protein [Deltaproteobacteria bacterium]
MYRPRLVPVRTLLYVLAVVVALVVALAISVARAPYPRLRLERLAFRFLIPIGQRVLGLHPRPAAETWHGFAFERSEALRALRERYDLDAVVRGAGNDFERWVRLMHWARDRFPHRPNAAAPDAQAFDGAALLARRGADDGYLCGTIAPLLVQAVTALGGHARRVELRLTPHDSHVVTEVWSSHVGKWLVLDPDYDAWFTVDGIPQHALELHALWARGAVDAVRVHWRESPHNIYRADLEAGPRDFLRRIFTDRDWTRWDRERNQHKGERFAVRLLNYYSHVSFPRRNDWRSRPLPWWHPEGNHVQGSLVIAVPTMPDWEDFLVRVPTPDAFYGPPPA